MATRVSLASNIAVRPELTAVPTADLTPALLTGTSKMKGTKMSNKKLLTELQTILGGEPLPAVFARGIKPLKIGIYHDMRSRYPNATATDLSDWFAKWTSSRSYLERLAKHRRVQRYDLDGEPVGIVSDEERTLAQFAVSDLVTQAYREKRPWDRPRTAA
jgi:sRNA-binding protein